MTIPITIPPGQSVRILYLQRGEHTYCFIFDESRVTDVLRTIGRWAADKDNPMTWYEAGILARQVRQEAAK